MQTGNDRNIFLSTLPATRRDHVAALAVVGVSAILFACVAPFATTPLAPAIDGSRSREGWIPADSGRMRSTATVSSKSWQRCCRTPVRLCRS